jgi:hypothetical protein
MAGYLKGQPPWQMIAYPWFEWKPKGNIYTTDNGLGPCFAVFGVLGIPYFALSLLKRMRAEQRVIALGACLLLVAGVGFWAAVLCFNVRYAMPVWCLALIMSGCLVDVLLRRHRYLATALVGGTLALGCAMVGLYTAKSMVARFVEGNRTRSHYYGLIPEMDSLPAGTVILNAAEGNRNYALLGEDLKYRVIESSYLLFGAIKLPVTQELIDRFGVNVVYTRADRPPPFAAGVRFEPLGSKGCAFRTYPTALTLSTAAKHESK